MEMSREASALLLRQARVARALDCGTRQVRHLIAAGHLDFVIIGRRRYVPIDSVLRLVEQRRQRVAVTPDQARARVREIAAGRRRGTAEAPAGNT
jgi:hypothetical protein